METSGRRGSFADDPDRERGVVSGRAASSPRSAEIKPSLPRIRGNAGVPARGGGRDRSGTRGRPDGPEERESESRGGGRGAGSRRSGERRRGPRSGGGGGATSRSPRGGRGGGRGTPGVEGGREGGERARGRESSRGGRPRSGSPRGGAPREDSGLRAPSRAGGARARGPDSTPSARSRRPGGRGGDRAGGLGALGGGGPGGPPDRRGLGSAGEVESPPGSGRATRGLGVRVEDRVARLGRRAEGSGKTPGPGDGAPVSGGRVFGPRAGPGAGPRSSWAGAPTPRASRRARRRGERRAPAGGRRARRSRKPVGKRAGVAGRPRRSRKPVERRAEPPPTSSTRRFSGVPRALSAGGPRGVSALSAGPPRRPSPLGTLSAGPPAPSEASRARSELLGRGGTPPSPREESSPGEGSRRAGTPGPLRRRSDAGPPRPSLGRGPRAVRGFSGAVGAPRAGGDAPLPAGGALPGRGLEEGGDPRAPPEALRRGPAPPPPSGRVPAPSEAPKPPARGRAGPGRVLPPSPRRVSPGERPPGGGAPDPGPLRAGGRPSPSAPGPGPSPRKGGVENRSPARLGARPSPFFSGSPVRREAGRVPTLGRPLPGRARRVPPARARSPGAPRGAPGPRAGRFFRRAPSAGPPGGPSFYPRTRKNGGVHRGGAEKPRSPPEAGPARTPAARPPAPPPRGEALPPAPPPLPPARGRVPRGEGPPPRHRPPRRPGEAPAAPRPEAAPRGGRPRRPAPGHRRPPPRGGAPAARPPATGGRPRRGRRPRRPAPGHRRPPRAAGPRPAGAVSRPLRPASSSEPDGSRALSRSAPRRVPRPDPGVVSPRATGPGPGDAFPRGLGDFRVFRRRFSVFRALLSRGPVPPSRPAGSLPPSRGGARTPSPRARRSTRGRRTARPAPVRVSERTRRFFAFSASVFPIFGGPGAARAGTSIPPSRSSRPAETPPGGSGTPGGAAAAPPLGPAGPPVRPRGPPGGAGGSRGAFPSGLPGAPEARRRAPGASSGSPTRSPSSRRSPAAGSSDGKPLGRAPRPERGGALGRPPRADGRPGGAAAGGDALPATFRSPPRPRLDAVRVDPRPELPPTTAKERSPPSRVLPAPPSSRPSSNPGRGRKALARGAPPERTPSLSERPSARLAPGERPRFPPTFFRFSGAPLPRPRPALAARRLAPPSRGGARTPSPEARRSTRGRRTARPAPVRVSERTWRFSRFPRFPLTIFRFSALLSRGPVPPRQPAGSLPPRERAPERRPREREGRLAGAGRPVRRPCGFPSGLGDFRVFPLAFFRFSEGRARRGPGPRFPRLDPLAPRRPPRGLRNPGGRRRGPAPRPRGSSRPPPRAARRRGGLSEKLPVRAPRRPGGAPAGPGGLLGEPDAVPLLPALPGRGVLRREASRAGPRARSAGARSGVRRGPTGAPAAPRPAGTRSPRRSARPPALGSTRSGPTPAPNSRRPPLRKGLPPLGSFPPPLPPVRARTRGGAESPRSGRAPGANPVAFRATVGPSRARGAPAFSADVFPFFGRSPPAAPSRPRGRPARSPLARGRPNAVPRSEKVDSRAPDGPSGAPDGFRVDLEIFAFSAFSANVFPFFGAPLPRPRPALVARRLAPPSRGGARTPSPGARRSTRGRRTARLAPVRVSEGTRRFSRFSASVFPIFGGPGAARAGTSIPPPRSSRPAETPPRGLRNPGGRRRGPAPRPRGSSRPPPRAARRRGGLSRASRPGSPASRRRAGGPRGPPRGARRGPPPPGAPRPRGPPTGSLSGGPRARSAGARSGDRRGPTGAPAARRGAGTRSPRRSARPPALGSTRSGPTPAPDSLPISPGERTPPSRVLPAPPSSRPSSNLGRGRKALARGAPPERTPSLRERPSARLAPLPPASTSTGPSPGDRAPSPPPRRTLSPLPVLSLAREGGRGHFFRPPSASRLSGPPRPGGAARPPRDLSGAAPAGVPPRGPRGPREGRPGRPGKRGETPPGGPEPRRVPPRPPPRPDRESGFPTGPTAAEKKDPRTLVRASGEKSERVPSEPRPSPSRPAPSRSRRTARERGSPERASPERAPPPGLEPIPPSASAPSDFRPSDLRPIFARFSPDRAPPRRRERRPRDPARPPRRAPVRRFGFGRARPSLRTGRVGREAVPAEGASPGKGPSTGSRDEPRGAGPRAGGACHPRVLESPGPEGSPRGGEGPRGAPLEGSRGEVESRREVTSVRRARAPSRPGRTAGRPEATREGSRGTTRAEARSPPREGRGGEGEARGTGAPRRARPPTPVRPPPDPTPGSRAPAEEVLSPEVVGGASRPSPRPRRSLPPGRRRRERGGEDGRPVRFPTRNPRRASPRRGPTDPSGTGGLEERGSRRADDGYLVDPASSHMLVSKIKPCTSKYEPLHGETADGSLNRS